MLQRRNNFLMQFFKKLNIFIAIFFTLSAFDGLGQIVTIKVAKDTTFDIMDFVNFTKSDTAESYRNLKSKYFKYSTLTSGMKKMNCSDKAQNPPYTILNNYFVMDYCMWNSGFVYTLELTMLNPKYLSFLEVTKRLDEYGFHEAVFKKKKGIRESRFTYDYKKRHSIVWVKHKKGMVVSIRIWP
jgi:hypothetical protein